MEAKRYRLEAGYNAVSSRRLAAGVNSCLAAVLLIQPCAGQSQHGAGSDPSSFKLHASVSALGKTGIQDTVWRYFSEQGARAYANKDYAGAEKFYTASLQDADKHHIDDRNLSVIMANLGTALREQGAFDEAEGMFKQALSKSERLGTGPQSAYAYTLRQYAALLRKTGHPDQARFAYEAAKSGQRLSTGTTAFNRQPESGQSVPDLASETPRAEAETRPLEAEAQRGAPLDNAISSGAQADRPAAGGGPEQNLFIWNVVGVGLSPGQSHPDVQTLDRGSTYFTGSPGPYLKQVLDRWFVPQQ